MPHLIRIPPISSLHPLRLLSLPSLPLSGPSPPPSASSSPPPYGACCLDNFATKALNCDLLVNYDHSCLVIVTSSKIPTLYVFVEIQIDVDRLISAVRSNFPKSIAIALTGTVQFIVVVHAAKSVLTEDGYNVMVPQSKPLSAGEVLGCTTPTISRSRGIKVLVFVTDGRFHLEAFMIVNPDIKTFQFNPFPGVLVLEEYEYAGMKGVRKDMILRARGKRVGGWGRRRGCGGGGS